MKSEVLANKFKFARGQSASINDSLADGEYPNSTAGYIDVSECERFHVLIEYGDVAAQHSLALQATTGSDHASTLSNIDDELKLTKDTSDDVLVVMTCETRKLTEGSHFVTLDITDTPGVSYASILYLLDEPSKPVTQDTSVVPSDNELRYTADD